MDTEVSIFFKAFKGFATAPSRRNRNEGHIQRQRGTLKRHPESLFFKSGSQPSDGRVLKDEKEMKKKCFGGEEGRKQHQQQRWIRMHRVMGVFLPLPLPLPSLLANKGHTGLCQQNTLRLKRTPTRNTDQWNILPPTAIPWSSLKLIYCRTRGRVKLGVNRELIISLCSQKTVSALSSDTDNF